MDRRFRAVDVFAGDALTGNPLAVVLDADGLSSDEMLRFTRWMNLSETTFLLPPTTDAADYRLRIFTLDREMPFAGHPTLGSCHAWLEAGGLSVQPDRVVQECGAGLVPIRRDGDSLAFAAPSMIRDEPVDAADLDRLTAVLGIDRDAVRDSHWLDNGPGWAVLLLDSADAVLAVTPQTSAPERFDIGIVGPYPNGHAKAFEIRAFFSDHLRAIKEDPVTGSLNASAAQWLVRTDRAHPPYDVGQGSCVGRDGLVHITQGADGSIWVGGRSTTVVAGNVDL